MGILKDAILAAIQQEHPDAHWVGNFWYIKQRIKAIEDKKDKYTLDDMIRRH